MVKRTRSTAAAGRPRTGSSGFRQFARRQPLLIAALGLALGAVIGSFLRFTPEETELLGERMARLKERAGELKDSVSELAVDCYAQAKQATQQTIQTASDAWRDKVGDHSSSDVDESPLVVTDSPASEVTSHAKL